ncbi:MAG TPA: MraY family glycosyltransferase [Rhodanobacteraceae bacterium]|nr:MraY family glycosyltransferase [Rhodanobacteraceae bacterium]
MHAVAGCLAAFVLAVAGVLLLTPHAGRFGLVDHPAGRKQHAHPTPLIGGVAMLVAVILTMLLPSSEVGRASLGYGAAAILLTTVGLIDDRVDLSWRLRVVMQVVAALILVYVGGIRIEQVGNVFGFGSFDLGLLSVPFTVFATVGIINAINMVDGVDGLAGSLVLAALGMFAAAAFYVDNGAVLERVVVLAGGVAGFLVFNLPWPWRRQARIFMGNAGSAFLGLTIACFAFRLTQSNAHPIGPILALWLIPVPIMDCLVLMARRLRMGQSPFAADRGHIHHLMQDAGYRAPGIVMALVAFSLLVGLVAAIALRAHVPQVFLAAAFAILCVFYYWLTSRHARAIAFFRALRPRRLRRELLPVSLLDQERIGD